MTATASETSRRSRLAGLRAASPHWDPVRLILVVLVLSVVVAGLLLGSRPSSYAGLRGQVADGEVATVEVDGLGTPPGATGYSTVLVSWRDGPIRRTAEVVSARPLSEAPTDPGTVVIRGDVSADLRRYDPDVVVVPVGERRYGATLAGWEVPETLFGVYLALLLAGLALLAGGTEPRRATRWGWLWPIMMLPPLGLLAFLLLAAPGPTRQPADRARRLTGGWSFLLTVCVLSPLLT